MEAIKLCRLDTPIIFIEARINLSRFVVTGCAAKTSATVTFPSLNLISPFAFCFTMWLDGVAAQPSWVGWIKKAGGRVGVGSMWIAKMRRKVLLNRYSGRCRRVGWHVMCQSLAAT